MDKDSREALQVAKELTAKFIETRTVSPGNFAEIFPAVYGVVARAIAQSGQFAREDDANAGCAAPGTSRAAPRRDGGRSPAGASAGDRE